MQAHRGKLNLRFLGLVGALGAVAVLLAYIAARPARDVVSSHHPGGTNLAVRPFDKGRPEGAWVTWYEDRWAASETRYSRGAAVGPWIFSARPARRPDGRAGQARLLVAPFADGEAHGTWSRQFPDASERATGEYVRGRRHGAWRERSTPDDPFTTTWWWRGHDLGIDPSASALFADLESAPPLDNSALRIRLDAARVQD